MNGKWQHPDGTSAEDKFFGKTQILEDTTTYAKSDGPRIEFYAYERHGLTAYRDKECKTPITVEGDLKAGDTVYFEWPYGGVAPVVVSADRKSAENESLTVNLEFDKGHPPGMGPEWVGSCFGNKAAIARMARMDFT